VTAPALNAPTGAETLRGIGLVLVGFAVLVLSDAAVKWALPEAGSALGMVMRGLFGAAVVAALARGRGLRPVNRRLLIWRGGVHCAVSVAYYWAWEIGFPLGSTYVIGAATPLLMTLLAIPILGERVGWRRWSSTGVGLLGVLLVLRPGGEIWSPAALVLALATVGAALSRIWTRSLAPTDTPAAITFYLMLAHVPAGLLLLPAFPPAVEMPSAATWLALAVCGLCSGSAHFLFSRAYAIAPVSVLAPFEYSAILWGMLMGFAVWGEVPAWATLAGGAVIAGAGLYNLHRERVRARDEARAAALAAAAVPPPEAEAGATPVAAAMASAPPR